MSDKPIDQLAEPQSHDPVPDLVELFLNNNVYSPTYWVDQFIVQVIGKDPLGWATTEFAGDWAQMQKAGAAIRNLSKYSGSYESSIYAAVKDVDSSWRGNAADSARDYFGGLRDAISNQVGPLKNIAQDIDTFALSSYYAAQGISFLIQSIIDTAIIAVAEEAAAAAAASTGVGAIASVGLEAAVAYDMVKMVGLWNQVLTKYATFATAGETAVAAILDGVATVRSKDIPQLPSAGYHHPGVVE
ncbi:hypothetical protein [Nocardia arthritidis]|uniref:WXG100 family type VII secretion target n=1 Tax=Nocardia arthritidis TaxID=228602 RepID=A0A6G9YT97_9NOCA|nr:hypothetical protein [Nocardia arthritidis]QIS16424.1 hypothetical protein F5544_43080 [Nocardia arthritidis]